MLSTVDGTVYDFHWDGIWWVLDICTPSGISIMTFHNVSQSDPWR